MSSPYDRYETPPGAYDAAERGWEMRERPPAPASASPLPPSERSRAVAVALGFITGVFGGHRYYAGKIPTGLLMTCTFGGLGVWWLIDMIMVVTGEFRDKDGRKISQWTPADIGSYQLPQGVTREQLDQVHDELERMRAEMGDLHERLDFHERRLNR